MANDVRWDWAQWSPRTEIAPKCAAEDGRLVVAGNGNNAAYGGWQAATRVDGGHAYEFTARCTFTGLRFPPQQIHARLDWLDAKGERIRPCDHAQISGRDGEWTILRHRTYAPKEAASLRVELGIRWAAGGAIAWDRNVSLTQLDRLPSRPVRIATCSLRPHDTGSAAASVKQFVDLIDREGPGKHDLVCLPEGTTVVGSGLVYKDVAEPIPGPLTEMYSTAARRARSYIVAGVYERDGGVIYNTSILLDRDGKLVGKYRKTHLPQEEVEGGLTPGDAYPIFDTDFGKVGMMLCWDVQFPEPARELARQGAEIILLPIWGGHEVLARARAIENHVFLVSSSYDMRTMIVDPAGQVRAETSADKPMASATIDLDAPVLQLPWLGNLQGRCWTERRVDL